MARRPYLKLRLSANAPAYEAERVIKCWTQQRAMSRNLVNAVLLYDALMAGDLSVLENLHPAAIREIEVRALARALAGQIPSGVGASVGAADQPKTQAITIRPSSNSNHDAQMERGLDALLGDDLEF